jgi:hypothetical protein
MQLLSMTKNKGPHRKNGLMRTHKQLTLKQQEAQTFPIRLCCQYSARLPTSCDRHAHTTL